MATNPSRVKSIESRWRSDVNRRFKSINKFMLSIPLKSLTTNASAADQVVIKNFMRELTEYSTGVLMSVNWQNPYQTQSYERGIARAQAEAKAALTAVEAASVPELNVQAAALVTSVEHAAELKFLHDRANESLDKWLKDMLFQTRNILHEQLGIVDIDSIHDAITERINVTSSRARTIAATETYQASQRSVLKEGQEINKRSDVKFEALWITVHDSKVRHLHRTWHKVIMSIEQASRNITISPWNCRCAVKLVVRDRISARVLKIYKVERAELLKMTA